MAAFPITVNFLNMLPSPAVEQRVVNLAEKLEHYYQGIQSCHVVLEPDQRHHHKGVLYQVRIELTVPGTTLVVNKDHHDKAHEDLYVAVSHAFKAIRRQLVDFSRIQRGDVKRHEESPRGHVAELNVDDGYGFIETIDGRMLRFTSASLVAYEFSQLRVGDNVRYIEALDAIAPAASTIRVE